jgi:hypothetical protein
MPDREDIQKAVHPSSRFDQDKRQILADRQVRHPERKHTFPESLYLSRILYRFMGIHAVGSGGYTAPATDTGITIVSPLGRKEENIIDGYDG